MQLAKDSLMLISYEYFDVYSNLVVITIRSDSSNCTARSGTSERAMHHFSKLEINGKKVKLLPFFYKWLISNRITIVEF